MQGNVSKELYLFFNNLEPLVDKILLLLIQLPPYLTKKEGFESLEKMVKMMDSSLKSYNLRKHVYLSLTN